MELLRITSRNELDEQLEAESFLLFKHSPTCPISTRARTELEAFLEQDPTLAVGWIHVVVERELSRSIESRFGIRHESPQAILFQRGTPVWNASHSAITRDALRSLAPGSKG